MRSSISHIAFAALCVPLLHCGDDVDKPSTPGPDTNKVTCTEGAAPSAVAGFSRYTVEGAAAGPSFASVGDVNGDGAPDLVLSEFGPYDIDDATGTVTLTPGRVSVYYKGEGLNCWQRAEIATEQDTIYFPNQTKLFDVDDDGDLDVIVPSGFFVCGLARVGPCGTLAWFENDAGAFKRHSLVTKNASFFHSVEVVDFDGDGTRDLVTVGETSTGAEAQYLKGNASADRFDKPVVLGEGLGSFPSVLDIDGDGDLDIGSAEYFVEGGAFAWLERTQDPSAAAPGGAFTRHVINTDAYRSIMLRFIPDFYGDGVLRAVGSNHTNTNRDPPDPESAIFAFDIPEDPTTLWPKTTISSGIVSRKSEGFGFQAAPGVFGYGDIDGDGDIDLAVSGDGDAHTYWMEQTGPGAFTMHVIEEDSGQASGTIITDLDGDGKNEVVFTGYEDSALYVYARE